ncbi:DUF4212 domain-containing protein [Anaerobacillus sp. MEB173]|uniref:DUF4212 domain-containing protein n=1 Tax=Anaerobacillus sp. MEB173 TaxID=3383345 RepID=UPI003F93DE43
MKKIDKSIADAYFRKRTRNMFIYLAIGFLASFGVVMFQEFFSQFTFLGMPFHYYMGAQGAILVFIAMLVANAAISDKIDKDFGIDDEASVRIGAGNTLDH